MGVSRSGYYKWYSTTRNHYNIRREQIVAAVERVYKEHGTHSYRWIANYLRLNEGLKVSDSFVFKCYYYLGLKSKSEHKRKERKTKPRQTYPNLIYSTWDTVDRPHQAVVSDMTVFSFYQHYFEVTFFFDVFTKEILTYRVASKRGSSLQYTECLKDMKELLSEEKDPVIMHTDRGSVYTSNKFNELFKLESKFKRSMSRPGKPTDNPVNESLNGWIKEELFIDFDIRKCYDRKEFEEAIRKYVSFYNNRRPCWAIGYNIPSKYKKMFDEGLLEQRDSFENRKLSEIPKFVQKRIEKAKNHGNVHF